MRRLLPLWSSLFAMLLLSQWTGAGAACLARAAGHGGAVCIAAVADEHPAPAPGHHAVSAGCPLCAPLPPAILPGPAAIVPRPVVRPTVFVASKLAWAVPLTPLPSPLQARAPPART